MLVCKFGGSSLANATQFEKVKDIILSDTDRRYVVPSAPGKRDVKDDKVTDLLYLLYFTCEKHQEYVGIFQKIQDRFNQIIADLHLDFSLEEDFITIQNQLKKGTTKAYIASRGEYLCGKVLAKYLNFDFIDAKDVVRFSDDCTLLEEETNTLLCNTLSEHKYAVIPGFYGAKENGDIVTFSRGGSDISGALVSRAVNADVYENFTDITGFRMADPRIVHDAQYINNLTYRELRELSYMGATVLHEDAVFPVRRAGIPTNIKNTNEPKHPGTMISARPDMLGRTHTITGIAGRKGFTIISIEKDMMNLELGFGKRVLQALEEYGISFENLPTGIDTMCVVVASSDLEPHREKVLQRIKELVQPDFITVHDHLALIATVGHGMVRTHGTAARLFTAISSQGISIRTIDQGSSELNIIVGVDDGDFERAVSAIYDTFVRM